MTELLTVAQAEQLAGLLRAAAKVCPLTTTHRLGNLAGVIHIDGSTRVSIDEFATAYYCDGDDGALYHVRFEEQGANSLSRLGKELTAMAYKAKQEFDEQAFRATAVKEFQVLMKVLSAFQTESVVVEPAPKRGLTGLKWLWRKK